MAIPYGKQLITDEDIQAVISVLKSNFLTQGPKIEEFEGEFAKYIGCKYAIAVSNGTAALHLCAIALEIKKGDKVITTPITFAASANCVRYCDGEVVFSDIDPISYLLDIDGVRKLLEDAPKGTYKGIIPVDFAGRAVNLEAFKELADQYGLWIIEDACHAPGGYFVDSTMTKQNCGNGTFADLAIFSFHPVKHIATGEGGMITTNSEALYHKLLQLRTHGIIKNAAQFSNDISFAEGVESTDSITYPEWYMEMQALGYNYRLSDIHAALGISQLKRAGAGMVRRKEIAQKYDDAFNGKSFIKGQSGFVNGHAYHLYILEVEDRQGLYNHLRKKGIFAQIHYIPCHLMPYYKELGSKEGDMSKAESYYKNCISLPMYPALTEEEQRYVIEKIDEYCNK